MSNSISRQKVIFFDNGQIASIETDEPILFTENGIIIQGKKIFNISIPVKTILNEDILNIK